MARFKFPERGARLMISNLSFYFRFSGCLNAPSLSRYFRFLGLFGFRFLDYEPISPEISFIAKFSCVSSSKANQRQAAFLKHFLNDRV